ncbi:unnamed protein product [Cylindrotheca closterium]|uniref:Uncharacterized protein n=1 Tax=Cylindrotheca closterium TaxID=2856 RepID=A0AAD2PVY4_9STRA|nr:unnamed protein product [Cylindrotheca closterium]
MEISNLSLSEQENGLACIWIYCMGDDEEDVAMWDEASISSPSFTTEDEECSSPARRSASIYNEQQVETHVKSSVSAAMERARQRHSLNLERKGSPRSSPRSSPQSLKDRKRVRLSMVTALSKPNLDL